MVRRAGLSTERVVTIALELLDEQGLEAMTLAGVAQRAQVATPSLYKHVGSLADLRSRVAAVALDQLAARIGAAVAGVARDDALRAMMRAYRAYLLAYPRRTWALVKPSETGGDSRGAVAILDAALAVLRGYGLTGHEAIHAARGLRAAMHGFAGLESDGGFGLPENLDESFERLQDMLIAGLESLTRRGDPPTLAS